MTFREKIEGAFSDLIFDEEKHLYFIKRDGRYKNLKSVSKKVESHAPKFNPNLRIGNSTLIELSARKTSRLEGKEVTPHELERRWQLLNQTACDLGHKVHDFLEHFTGIETPYLPQEKAGVQFLRDHMGQYRIEIKELRTYSERYGIAGTMDLPLEILDGSGELIIADYKTNGDLFKSYDNLLPPFDFLQSTPYNKYQLQLSYYQILLEEKGFKIRERWLVYLMADATYKVYKLNDFTQDLRELMEAA